MRNTNYKKGYNKERRIVNQFRAAKCLAFRSAGSHSPIDVFVLDPLNHVIKLIQSKAGKISDLEKERILSDIKKFEGIYEVEVHLWAG